MNVFNIYTTGPYIYKELGDSNWKKKEMDSFSVWLKDVEWKVVKISLYYVLILQLKF